MNRFLTKLFVTFLLAWTLSLSILTALALQLDTTNRHEEVSKIDLAAPPSAPCTEDDTRRRHHDGRKKQRPLLNHKSIQSQQQQQQQQQLEVVDRNWCPTAVCHDSAICRPCQTRFLILLTTGRSASTTVAKMLNALPNIRIGGENNDLLQRMQTTILDDTLEHSSFQQWGSNTDSAWHHNPVYEGSHACVTQKMIQVINPPREQRDVRKEHEVILGFKTIRFHRAVNLTKAVEFVKESLPCARILVNIRSNTTAQALSQMTAFQKKNIRPETLDRENERLIHVAEKLFGKDQAMVLDSSRWTKNITHLNQAVEWLGFHKSCYFQDLLQFNTQNSFLATGSRRVRGLSLECRYVGK
jgi:hypothetical protein